MADVAYFACLLDWRNKFVGMKEEQFTKSILQPSKLAIFGSCMEDSHIESWPDWKKALVKCDNVKHASTALFLVTHSRLIIKFTLRWDYDFKNLREIREARDELEVMVKKYLLVVCSEMSNTLSFPVCNGPRIFFYAIFELGEAKFWIRENREAPQPASLSTTCFYTRLPDLGRVYLVRPRDLKMRISGAMIVTEEMSSWFFWNLTNLVFHQGLYKQERDDALNVGFDRSGVQFGLENRLEVFADHVTNSFNQLLIASQSARLNQLLLYWTTALALIGYIITRVR